MKCRDCWKEGQISIHPMLMDLLPSIRYKTVKILKYMANIKVYNGIFVCKTCKRVCALLYTEPRVAPLCPHQLDLLVVQLCAGDLIALHGSYCLRNELLLDVHNGEYELSVRSIGLQFILVYSRATNRGSLRSVWTWPLHVVNTEIANAFGTALSVCFNN